MVGADRQPAEPPRERLGRRPEHGGERPAAEREAADEEHGQAEHDHRGACERGYTTARNGPRGREHACHHEK